MSHDASPVILGFREFLGAKADEFGIRGRHQKRQEWLDAIDRFFAHIKEWLDRADPEQLLDIEPYEVTRTEGPLGTYNAPALRIKFGPAQVDLIPIERLTGVQTTAVFVGSPSGVSGRIDMTNGYERLPVYRVYHQDGESWRFFESKWVGKDFDEESFVQKLQEYLS